MSATYSSIRSSKASIKGYFQSLGYQVSDIIEETYGISTYLTMTAVKNKTNYIFAITKAGDSSKCFGISIENNTNTLDKTTLERISTVLSNAKYQGKTQEKTVEFNFQDAIK
jgi:hypothetical protein